MSLPLLHRVGLCEYEVMIDLSWHCEMVGDQVCLRVIKAVFYRGTLRVEPSDEVGHSIVIV